MREREASQGRTHASRGGRATAVVGSRWSRRQGTRRLLFALAALAALAAPRPSRAQTFTVARYTVPRRQALADTLCEEGTVRETMGSMEIWWWPKGSQPYILRVKNVAGRECLADTLRLPASPVALARVVAIDAAGNRACDLARWTEFNASGAIGVGQPGPSDAAMDWYDVSGRRVEQLRGMTFDQARVRWHSSEVLFARAPGSRTRKLVILR